MSARVTVTANAVASPPAAAITSSGQAFFAGQTVRGPINQAVQVFGLADYRATFGERTGGADMWDAVSSAFKEGLGSAWILRMSGASAAAATVTLDSKLTITADEVGAWANSKAVDWDDSENQLTIDGTAYVGASVTALQAAIDAAGEPYTLSGTMAEVDDSDTLASGTDDFAAAVVADSLEFFTLDLGDGAVALPDYDSATVYEDLQDHCAATWRTGVVASTDLTDDLADALTDVAAVAGENLVFAAPAVTYSSATGTQTISPIGAVIGLRARAKAGGGPKQSPLYQPYGTCQWISGVVDDATDSEWAALNAAGASVIRTVGGRLRLYSYKTVDAPDSATNLQGAEMRDCINAVAVACSQIAETFVGRTIDGKGRVLGQFEGALVGRLSAMKDAFFAGENDPGYLVDVGPGVNPTASLATGTLKAAVGVRLAPTAELITIEVTAVDAGTDL